MDFTCCSAHFIISTWSIYINFIAEIMNYCFILFKWVGGDEEAYFHSSYQYLEVDLLLLL